MYLSKWYGETKDIKDNIALEYSGVNKKQKKIKTVCQFFNFCLLDFRNYFAMHASVINW